jgi:hypothetical protein
MTPKNKKTVRTTKSGLGHFIQKRWQKTLPAVLDELIEYASWANQRRWRIARLVLQRFFEQEIAAKEGTGRPPDPSLAARFPTDAFFNQCALGETMRTGSLFHEIDAVLRDEKELFDCDPSPRRPHGDGIVEHYLSNAYRVQMLNACHVSRVFFRRLWGLIRTACSYRGIDQKHGKAIVDGIVGYKSSKSKKRKRKKKDSMRRGTSGRPNTQVYSGYSARGSDIAQPPKRPGLH